MRAAPLAQRPRSRPASSAQRRRPHPLRPRAAAADTPPPDLAALRTPHSGYHDDGSGRRFFEGWYFKVTLPGSANAFALIYSVEDPAPSPSAAGRRGRVAPAPRPAGARPGVGAQIMGPRDGYLVQYTPDTGGFWADPDSLSLGACFTPAPRAAVAPPRRAVAPADFDAAVAHGFQATPTWHQGAIVAREAGTGGTLTSSVPSARWAFSVAPTLGWGPPPPAPQRATAGWLAALPVFEPHWQVVMARGSATGWLEWGGEKFDFADAPCYAEKNWGAGFPRRWWWVQCDAFDGDERAALTAVGSTRGLGGVPGVEEEVGMVGLHWGGRFYELVPWRGSIAWEVAPWGSWRVVARGDGVEAEIEATCDGPGTPLRAPTPDRGLAVLCRDSFGGTVTVKLWATEGAGGGRGELLATLTSSRVAVETGGGPWPGGAWRATAAMRQPFRALAGAPVDAGWVAAALPARWRPKGL